MSVTSDEIATQPETWRLGAERAGDLVQVLPRAGARVAIVGCGTSHHVAQSIATARELDGLGETDAFVASEMPSGRRYDLVVAISRSGTTTEVVRALESLPPGTPTLAVSAAPGSPVATAAVSAVILDFADERSVVQTRFATTTLALFRAHLGHDVETAARDAERAIAAPLPVDPERVTQFVFLGRGWSVGLAHEAALKLREAGGAWSEAYPAMEYRHGPISVAGPRTTVWTFGPEDDELLDDIRHTGAAVVEGCFDPMAELVLAQRVAVALAEARGLDSDRPRHLSRSVVLR
jgi:fructoselysine-6-P-deglycase FrlB-like protein